VHKRIRHALVKIGEMEGYDARTEWPTGGTETFDGAWLVQDAEVPMYVFEVQVGGDPHLAIGKLQRARNKWGNCEIRMVTTTDQIAEMRALLESTLHQRDRVAAKVVDAKAIDRVKQHLTAVRDRREEIGYEPR
jgi:hypothetical protein